nr:MAG TPA: hypothetical protein [Caudoviricetes sp.]
MGRSAIGKAAPEMRAAFSLWLCYHSPRGNATVL